VSPANDFSNLWPRKISFRTGGVINLPGGYCSELMETAGRLQHIILGWLGGYAAFLGPVAGIMICDYFLVRKCVLQVDDLYLRGGVYEYSNGFNWRAVACTCARSWDRAGGSRQYRSYAFLYDYSWFVGFAVSFVGLLRDDEISPAACPFADDTS